MVNVKLCFLLHLIVNLISVSYSEEPTKKIRLYRSKRRGGRTRAPVRTTTKKTYNLTKIDRHNIRFIDHFVQDLNLALVDFKHECFMVSDRIYDEVLLSNGFCCNVSGLLHDWRFLKTSLDVAKRKMTIKVLLRLKRVIFMYDVFRRDKRLSLFAVVSVLSPLSGFNIDIILENLTERGTYHADVKNVKLDLGDLEVHCLLLNRHLREKEEQVKRQYYFENRFKIEVLAAMHVRKTATPIVQRVITKALKVVFVGEYRPLPLMKLPEMDRVAFESGSRSENDFYEERMNEPNFFEKSEKFNGVPYKMDAKRKKEEDSEMERLYKVIDDMNKVGPNEAGLTLEE